jgi:hypothetical protein
MTTPTRLFRHLQHRPGESIHSNPHPFRWYTEDRHYHVIRPILALLHFLRAAQHNPDISTLPGRYSAGTRLLFRLIGWHSPFLAITRGSRAVHIYGLSSTDFRSTGSSSTQRSASSDRPRSPPSVTGCPPNGSWPMKELVTHIQGCHTSKTAIQLRRFLGMLNFYRRFLHHAAAIQTSLHDVPSVPRFKGSHRITSTPELRKRICQAPLCWSTSIHLRHLHSAQTPPRTLWVPYCNDAPRTSGKPSPSSPRNSTWVSRKYSA